MEVGREESTWAANHPLQRRNSGVDSKGGGSIHQEEQEGLLKALLFLPPPLAAPAPAPPYRAGGVARQY